MGKIKQKIMSGLIATSMMISSVVPAFASGLQIKNENANNAKDVSLIQEITKDNEDGTFDVEAIVRPEGVLYNKDKSLEIIFDIDRSLSMSDIISGIGDAMDNFIDYAITNNPNKNVKIGFVGYGGDNYTGDDYGTFKPTDDVSAIKTALYQSGQDSKFRNVQVAMDYFTKESKATNKVFVEISDGIIIPSLATIPDEVDSYGIATIDDMNEFNDLGNTNPDGVVLNSPQEAFEYITSSKDNIYHAPKKEDADKALKEIMEKSVGKAPEDLKGDAEFIIPDKFEIVGTPSASKGDVSLDGNKIIWKGINLSDASDSTLNYTLRIKDESLEDTKINENASLELSNGGSAVFPIPSVSIEKEEEQTPEPPAPKPEEPEVENNPEIKLTKTADKKEVKQSGDNISYTIVIENTGDCDLNITDFDDSLVPDLELEFNKLAAGEKQEVKYSYKVKDEDLESSNIINTAKIKAKDDNDNEVKSEDKVETKVIKEEPKVEPTPVPEPILNPSVKVEKEANKSVVHEEGEEIEYVVTITNDGETDLEITSIDDSLVDLELEDKVLLKGENKEIKYTYTVSKEDLNKDSIDNTIEVVAIDDNNIEVSDKDSISVNVDKKEEKQTPAPIVVEPKNDKVIRKESKPVEVENPYKKVQTSDESGSNTIFAGIGILALSGVLYLGSSRRKQLN